MRPSFEIGYNATQLQWLPSDFDIPPSIEQIERSLMNLIVRAIHQRLHSGKGFEPSVVVNMFHFTFAHAVEAAYQCHIEGGDYPVNTSGLFDGDIMVMLNPKLSDFVEQSSVGFVNFEYFNNWVDADFKAIKKDANVFFEELTACLQWTFRIGVFSCTEFIEASSGTIVQHEQTAIPITYPKIDNGMTSNSKRGLLNKLKSLLFKQ